MKNNKLISVIGSVALLGSINLLEANSIASYPNPYSTQLLSLSPSIANAWSDYLNSVVQVAKIQKLVQRTSEHIGQFQKIIETTENGDSLEKLRREVIKLNNQAINNTSAVKIFMLDFQKGQASFLESVAKNGNNQEKIIAQKAISVTQESMPAFQELLTYNKELAKLYNQIAEANSLSQVKNIFNQVMTLQQKEVGLIPKLLPNAQEQLSIYQLQSQLLGGGKDNNTNGVAQYVPPSIANAWSDYLSSVVKEAESKKIIQKNNEIIKNLTKSLKTGNAGQIEKKIEKLSQQNTETIQNAKELDSVVSIGQEKFLQAVIDNGNTEEKALAQETLRIVKEVAPLNQEVLSLGSQLSKLEAGLRNKTISFKTYMQKQKEITLKLNAISKKMVTDNAQEQLKIYQLQSELLGGRKTSFNSDTNNNPSNNQSPNKPQKITKTQPQVGNKPNGGDVGTTHRSDGSDSSGTAQNNNSNSSSNKLPENLNNQTISYENDQVFKDSVNTSNGTINSQAHLNFNGSNNQFNNMIFYLASPDLINDFAFGMSTSTDSINVNKIIAHSSNTFNNIVFQGSLGQYVFSSSSNTFENITFFGGSNSESSFYSQNANCIGYYFIGSTTFLGNNTFNNNTSYSQIDFTMLGNTTGNIMMNMKGHNDFNNSNNSIMSFDFEGITSIGNFNNAVFNNKDSSLIWFYTSGNPYKKATTTLNFTDTIFNNQVSINTMNIAGVGGGITFGINEAKNKDIFRKPNAPLNIDFNNTTFKGKGSYDFYNGTITLQGTDNLNSSDSPFSSANANNANTDNITFNSNNTLNLGYSLTQNRVYSVVDTTGTINYNGNTQYDLIKVGGVTGTLDKTSSSGVYDVTYDNVNGKDITLKETFTNNSISVEEISSTNATTSPIIHSHSSEKPHTKTIHKNDDKNDNKLKPQPIASGKTNHSGSSQHNTNKQQQANTQT
ncbi:hypothetical protein, partial [Helicobacter cetorum]|uniref:hypothetical protein n=1 Tax=Helicobacter cetorum TaxID=138563 RepID=UPI0013154B42